MKLEIWNNLSGYHWNVTAADWHLESGRSLKTKAIAEKSARRICRKLGVKIHCVEDQTIDL